MKLGNVDFKKDNTYIMAILNLTPDSFYDGGRFFFAGKLDYDRVLYRVKEMIDEGADIIDIGGESTRPNFTAVSVDEELSRIMPALRAIKKEFDIPVSVDTYKAATAREAISKKADLINDIGFLSDEMLGVLTGAQSAANSSLGATDNIFSEDATNKTSVAYCLTHNRNIKITDRDEATITMSELCNEMEIKLQQLRDSGFNMENVIVDPGIGFGKSNRDDIMVLSSLSKFHELKQPILIGASNKSCVDYIIPSDKADRLEGTLAITAQSFYNNVNFIRVHDVRANRRLIDMLNAMR